MEKDRLVSRSAGCPRGAGRRVGRSSSRSKDVVSKSGPTGLGREETDTLGDSRHNASWRCRGTSDQMRRPPLPERSPTFSNSANEQCGLPGATSGPLASGGNFELGARSSLEAYRPQLPRCRITQQLARDPAPSGSCRVDEDFAERALESHWAFPPQPPAEPPSRGCVVCAPGMVSSPLGPVAASP